MKSFRGRSFGWVALGFLAVGCDTTRVAIPPASQDKAPVITLHALTSGGQGHIEVPEAKSPYWRFPYVNHVTVGTDLLITVDASNPGGVRELSLSITQGAGVLYSVVRKATPDAQNKVPSSLSIAGSNGMGGIGGNPLRALIAGMNDAVHLQATAVNFNGQTTQTQMHYVPLGHVTASLTSDVGVIRPGGSALLTYRAQFAHAPLEITNFGTAGSGSGDLSGIFSVSPSQTTTYTLKARNFVYMVCTLPNKLDCLGAEEATSRVTVKVQGDPVPPTPKTETQRVELLGQGLGGTGYRPYVYGLVPGNTTLDQIALPSDTGNYWVAGIKLVKAGHSTDECGNSNAYVYLAVGEKTTPDLLQSLYGATRPTFTQVGNLVACVSPKTGAPEINAVGVLITYTNP